MKNSNNEQLNLETENKVKINPLVLWGSMLIAALIYVPMMIWQEKAAVIINSLYGMLTEVLWMWEFVFAFVFIFVIWLGFSKYGNIKMGRKEDDCEFSTFTWLSMIFAAAVGAGLVYFSFVEPIQIIANPPFGAEPGTAQAAEFALAYGIFNWGPIAWSIFALTGIIFSYNFHVRKEPYLYPSHACRSILGKKTDGILGKGIDILVIVGLVGATATTMGVVVPLLAALIADIVGISDTVGLQVLVAIVFSNLWL